MFSDIGVVVIGRDEGDRLKLCLRSVMDCAAVVYVDSGSSDGSVPWAQSQNVDVINLAEPPYSAAKARNAGLRHVMVHHPKLAFVQMIDGDCELRPGWLASARAAFDAGKDIAGVIGRRRERQPDRSIYNALCDDEWNIALGDAPAFGGDVLLRISALLPDRFYCEEMIAGEDPDLSLRLRAAGWRIARIDEEMTLHDAAILSFGQWRRRVTRAGHAFADLAQRHPESRRPDWRRQCRSIIMWGGIFPAMVIMSLMAGLLFDHRAWIFSGLSLVGWLAMVARIARRKRRQGLPGRIAGASGLLLMLGKTPECIGLLRYHVGRMTGRSSQLIEYKGVAQR